MNLGKPEQRRLITPVSTADIGRIEEPAEPPAAEYADAPERDERRPVPADD
jgi:hypothetical protein